MTIKKVGINTILYGTVGFLRKGISVLLIPLYTRYLSTADYGIISVLTSITSFLIIFFNFGMQTATIRFYFQNKTDETYVKNLWGTILSFILYLSIFVSLLFVLFGRYIFTPLLGNIPLYPFFYLALISVATEPLFNIYQSTLQAKQQGYRYGFQNLAHFMLNLSLIILFVVVFNLKAVGVLAGAAICNVVFFIYTLLFFARKLTMRINFKILKPCLAYSLPLIPNRMAGWGTAVVNKIFINTFRSTAEVGIYNIGFLFANALTLLSSSFDKAYLPWFLNQMETGGTDGRLKIIRLANTYVLFFSYLAFVSCLVCKKVISLFAFGAFKEGWVVFPFLVFLTVFIVVKNVWLQPLLYNKKGTRYAPFSTYTAAVLNIGLGLTLIPRYGIIGAAVGSLIARFISTFVMLYYSQKIEKIDYNVLRIYSYTVIAFFLSMVVYLNLDNILFIKLLMFTVVSMIVFIIARKDLIFILNIVFPNRFR